MPLDRERPAEGATSDGASSEVVGRAADTAILADTPDVPEQQRRTAPYVRCQAYTPAGNRTRFLIVVDRCPYCQGAHQHYAADVAALLGAVKSGCRRPYRLAGIRMVTGGVS